MKRHDIALIISLAASATASANPYSLTASTIGNGSPQATAGVYTADLCIGAGDRGGAGMAESSGGYAGQLIDPLGLAVAAGEPVIPELGTNAFGAAAAMDDGTLLMLEASEVDWSPAGGPLMSVSLSGIATAGKVFRQELATVEGIWAGFAAQGDFLIDDTESDNVDPVAGDGIEDGWQFTHFDADDNGALDASEAALAGADGDADADGQSNTLEWLAGYDPLDASSRFEQRLLAVDANNVTLWLSSMRPGIRYDFLATPDLKSPPALIDSRTVTETQTGVTVQINWTPFDQRGFFRVELDSD